MTQPRTLRDALLPEDSIKVLDSFAQSLSHGPLDEDAIEQTYHPFARFESDNQPVLETRGVRPEMAFMPRVGQSLLTARILDEDVLLEVLQRHGQLHLTG